MWHDEVVRSGRGRVSVVELDEHAKNCTAVAAVDELTVHADLGSGDVGVDH